jgi:hypothetical protein
VTLLLLCFYCPRPATVTFTAQGGGEIQARAESSCPAHHQRSRTWCSRAGPVKEEPIAHAHDPDADQRLF